MAKKNELPALMAALLVTFALLGGGAWWLKNNILDATTPNSDGDPAAESDGGSRRSRSSTEAGSGQAILSENLSDAKQKGLGALAGGDYEEAKVELTAALAENKNDPESLIALNNAEIGDERAYTLAVIVPAGASEGAAAELMRGAAQAQADINAAGGVSGRPIKLRLINDDDDAERASEIASDLVADDDVLGVVGHYSSGTTLAAAEVYEAGQLPMISPTSTAVDISNAGDYIFRTVPSDRLAAATLSRYVLNELNENQAVVFYTEESAYSKSVKSEFTTELLSNGGEVVANFDVSESGFDAQAALEAAEEEGATVLMLALNTATIEIANDVIQENAQDLPMVGGDSLYNPVILKESGADALGLVVAVPWHILSHLQSPFVAESRQLWGGDVNWRTATAYDAVKALAVGLEANQSREGLAAALAGSGLEIEGATDAIRFLPTGDRNQASQLVEVVPGTRSGTGYDYEPVK